MRRRVGNNFVVMDANLNTQFQVFIENEIKNFFYGFWWRNAVVCLQNVG